MYASKMDSDDPHAEDATFWVTLDGQSHTRIGVLGFDESKLFDETRGNTITGRYHYFMGDLAEFLATVSAQDIRDKEMK